MMPALPIFPVRGAGKVPLVDNWPERATTDGQQIARWGIQFPGCNWGMPTGPASGCWVLDADGVDGLAALDDHQFDLGGLASFTGGGGMHLFFAWPEGMALGNRAGLLPGLDVRGEGGYVVIPPSRHASGRDYQWRQGADWPPPPAPAHLLALLRPQLVPALPEHRGVLAHDTGSSYVEAAIAGEYGRVALAQPGTRNHALNRAAFALGQLVADGRLEQARLEQVLTRAAQACGLLEQDGELVVLRTIRSGLDAGLTHPRPATINHAPASSAAPPVAPQPLEYMDLGEIARVGLPPVPWLLPGWLAQGDVAVLAGDGGIGKSTTLCAIALALASGTEWCGITPSKPMSVLYFDEEQSEDELARIMLSLLPSATVPPLLRVAASQGVNLDADFGRLELEIATHRPALVCLDSVQQTFGGVDENDATAVGTIFAKLFRMRRDYGTAFALAHHLRKPPTDGQRPIAYHLIRGSVAFFTQASTAWVATQPTSGTMDLVQYKRRRGSKLSLRIECESSPGKVRLTARGAVEDFEAELERCQRCVVLTLAQRGQMTTADLCAAAKAEGIGQRTAERCLTQLGKMGTLSKVKRGLWRLSDATAAAQQLL